MQTRMIGSQAYPKVDVTVNRRVRSANILLDITNIDPEVGQAVATAVPTVGEDDRPNAIARTQINAEPRVIFRIGVRAHLLRVVANPCLQVSWGRQEASDSRSLHPCYSVPPCAWKPAGFHGFHACQHV